MNPYPPLEQSTHTAQARDEATSNQIINDLFRSSVADVIYSDLASNSGDAILVI